MTGKALTGLPGARIALRLEFGRKSRSALRADAA